MAVRTIKYLVVDNIIDDVPDSAPEIDAPIDSAADVAIALVKLAGAPSNGDIYLRTPRSDGSLRWQPLGSLTALPADPVITAKVVRARGGSARPAVGPRPVAQTTAPTGGHGMSHVLGGLFKKLAVGGSSAAGGSTGGFGHMGGLGGVGRVDDDQYQEQLREQQMIQELEHGGLRRDDENSQGWTNMDNNAGPDPEACHHASDNSSSDHDGDHNSNHDDNDTTNDNGNDNNDDDQGGWQTMDNDPAGVEPDDNDNTFDDNDDNGNDSS